MTFDEYQERAVSTAFGDQDTRLMQMVLGLVGESGEVAEKFKKWLRDDHGKMNKLDIDIITKEIGDILWYIAALSDELEIKMEDVAKTNLDKLASRKKRNKLKGSGDER